MYLSTHTHTHTHMTESLYCILETNMILQIYYNNKILKKKKIRISRLKMKSWQKWEELRIPVSWKRYSLDTFTIQQENEAELTGYDLNVDKKKKNQTWGLFSVSKNIVTRRK